MGFGVLVGAVELVFAADGVIAFLYAWELMTLATAAPALVRAAPGNIVPDFPVINKSFNLSYSGNDR